MTTTQAHVVVVLLIHITCLMIFGYAGTESVLWPIGASWTLFLIYRKGLREETYRNRPPD